MNENILELDKLMETTGIDSRFICDLSIRGNKCWYANKPYNSLICENGLWRCSTRAGCFRVTPNTGKLVRREVCHLSRFQAMFINRKLKAIKNKLISPYIITLKRKKGSRGRLECSVILTDKKDKNKTMKFDPKRFSSNWWLLDIKRK